MSGGLSTPNQGKGHRFESTLHICKTNTVQENDPSKEVRLQQMSEKISSMCVSMR